MKRLNNVLEELSSGMAMLGLKDAEITIELTILSLDKAYDDMLRDRRYGNTADPDAKHQTLCYIGALKSPIKIIQNRGEKIEEMKAQIESKRNDIAKIEEGIKLMEEKYGI